MLTEQERERVRSEEAFRAEIRKELGLTSASDTPTSFKKKLWQFLNSTFGLWFLSSVILAGMAKWYNDKQTERREEEKQKEQAYIESKATLAIRQRLLLEISYRFSSTLSRLKASHENFGASATAERQEAILSALEIMEKPPQDAFPPLFLEYKDFSGIALIAELQRHVSEIERPHLTRILRDTSVYIKEVAGKPVSAKLVAQGLLQRLRYSQWNALGFPYTTCPNQNPFC